MKVPRHPSRSEARRHQHELQEVVEAFHANTWPHTDAVAWPAELDRAILRGLPLPERTHGRLLHTGVMQGDDPLTVHEMLRMPNVGRKAIRDVLLSVDRFLNECINDHSTTPEQPTTAPEAIAGMATPGTPDTPWSRTEAWRCPLLAACTAGPGRTAQWWRSGPGPGRRRRRCSRTAR